MPPKDRVHIELEVSPPEAKVKVIGVEPVGGLFQKGGFSPKSIAAGRFQLDLLQGPDYHILAQAPGFRSDILPLTMRPGKPPTAEPLRITLALSHKLDVAATRGRDAFAVEVQNDRDWGTPVVYMQRTGLFSGPPILHTAA